jgi:hypothetical protein
MVHQSAQGPRRRSRFAFASLLSALVLALTFGAFASVAAATDEPSSDGVSALTTEPTPGANNPLPDTCGLNIVLVIDRSGSTQEFDSDYKDAANAFVDSLVGTPSHIGAVTFADSASVLSPYVDVSANAGNLHTLINALSTPDGSTNWQDALEVTTSNFTSPEPDLVLFITDGNPTSSNSGGPLSSGITAANTLKSNGTTHITGVGVGEGVDSANIAKITGAGVGIGGLNPDVHVVTDTTQLVKDLTALATELCGGTVTIHKTVQTGPDTFIDGDGWTFASGSSSDTTDVDGLANLEFDTDGAKTITETAQAGYSIASVDCTGGAEDATSVTSDSFSILVNQKNIITCEVVNTPDPGSITVKKVTTGDTGTFAFKVSGPNVSTNLSATTTQQNVAASAGTVSDLFAGEYTITETVPSGWSLTGIDCGTAEVSVNGSTVTVSVGIGESVECTYTDDATITVAPEVVTQPAPIVVAAAVVVSPAFTG